MKISNRRASPAVVILSAALFHVGVAAAPPPTRKAPIALPSKWSAVARFHVPGIRSNRSASVLVEKLNDVKGVWSVAVNPARSLTVVRYNPTRCKPGTLLAAIRKRGYRATMLR